MIESARDAGYSVEKPAFIQSVFNHAIGMGLGAHDIGALVLVLRPSEL